MEVFGCRLVLGTQILFPPQPSAPIRHPQESAAAMSCPLIQLSCERAIPTLGSPDETPFPPGLGRCQRRVPPLTPVQMVVGLELFYRCRGLQYPQMLHAM